VMMVLAIGAAGVASPASGSRDDAPVAGPRAVGSHHLEAYRNPAEALTEAMPVNPQHGAVPRMEPADRPAAARTF
jgi:hypothetical protein